MRDRDTPDPVPPLIGPGDPPPFEIVNPDGRGRVVLLCEHGGRAVPTSLRDLGLPQKVFDQHIAWDIGAAGVARCLSELLDAPLFVQRYSRLVIDCNRTKASPDLIPEIADGILIPGNRQLSQDDRQARYDAILRPFHDAVADALDARPEPGRTVLLMIHSYTPRLRSAGGERPMHLGFLFDRDPRLARALAATVRVVRPDLIVAENEPYECTELTDYAVPLHAEPRGLLHALVEIRNDQIRTPEDQATWGALLAQALTRALDTIEETTR